MKKQNKIEINTPPSGAGGPTPSQTIGPFFAYSLTAQQYGYNYDSIVSGSLVDETIEGQRIIITGQIFDGQGKPINDAVIELWQPDLRFENDKNSKSSIGFARLGTGPTPDHSFRFTTIKPKVANGQAPHINVIVMMRGSLHHLYTRLYFDDESEANEQDALLNAVPDHRRSTLIATKSERNNEVSYQFNIRIQEGENGGSGETVFFQV
jgi:protocatechuate 3,4-dioxygenase alpha subunit